jgi:hypothetical protein
MRVVQGEVLPCLSLSGEGLVAAEGYIGDVRSYAIIIEVELEDVSDSYSTNTNDYNVEFVGKFGL